MDGQKNPQLSLGTKPKKIVLFIILFFLILLGIYLYFMQRYQSAYKISSSGFSHINSSVRNDGAIKGIADESIQNRNQDDSNQQLFNEVIKSELRQNEPVKLASSNTSQNGQNSTTSISQDNVDQNNQTSSNPNTQTNTPSTETQNNPISINIIKPTSGAGFTQGDQMEITANASDSSNNGELLYQFSVDNIIIKSWSTQNSFQITAGYSAPKKHILTIEVKNNSFKNSISRDFFVYLKPVGFQ